MQDLQEVTHEIHYETFRSERLQLKTSEKQRKLIEEKDNEVKKRSRRFLSSKIIFISSVSASSNASDAIENAKSIIEIINICFLFLFLVLSVLYK